MAPATGWWRGPSGIPASPHALDPAIPLKPPRPHREHVSYVLAQVRGNLRLPAVGKVDEIHNLNLATRTGGDASDALKYFSERIPATFAYAGISVERAGLLNGTRGEQIAGRFSMIRTGPFPRNGQWTALIAALEDSLPLHRHEPGTLAGLDRYLHQRTGGMIGSLLRLARSAAVQAILDGTESVTRKTLDAIDVDAAAETGGRRT